MENISNPFQNESKDSESSRIDNSLNTDEFYQIHQSDILKAQEKQQIVSGEQVKQAQTPSTPSEENKKENHNEDSQIQENCEEKKSLNSENNNKNKNNFFYFIGLNSILLNLFQLKIFNNIIVQIIFIFGLLFGNIFTYLYLFKREQSRKLISKLQPTLKVLKDKLKTNISKINSENFQINKKKIIIGVGIIFLIILTTLSIVAFVRSGILIKNMKHQQQDIRFQTNTIEHLRQQYEKQIYSLQQKINNLESKINQLERFHMRR